jgi:hydrogenase/urease accessory protein HupE
VIDRDRITIEARISKEELMLVGTGGLPVPDDTWAEMGRNHAEYVLKHLRVNVDGKPVSGGVVAEATAVPAAGVNIPAAYRFEYLLAAPPGVVRIDQDLLSEYNNWTASCVVRVRQSTDAEFESALLTRDKSVEFGCDWSGSATATRPGLAVGTKVALWPTVRAYLVHGINHILIGYDHLLFISALVLAAASVWDLAKVVTAFTLAHTLTLALSVFNIVALPSRVVEPMIAASIVFVAVQNIFSPRSSTGWSRLAVAFAFGLFHGLGFAGGLKEAMSQMPSAALWTALISFSVGVEIGHQVVVIPLFGALYAARNWKAEQPRTEVARRILKLGSCAISLAGVYFLIQALRPGS